MAVSTISQAGLDASIALTSPALTSPTISGTPVMGASVITSGTSQASTSGTSIDFTGIPSWVKRVTILFKGVSISSTSQFLIQLGSGSIQTTGYIGGGTRMGASSVVGGTYTTGFSFSNTTAADAYSGTTTLTLFGSNIWIAAGVLGGNSGEFNNITGGDVTLSGALDRVRITTNGADTFDAGSINILYE